MAMVTEAIVRESWYQEIRGRLPGPTEAVHELWVPRSNERADLVVIGSSMLGFEIKTDRDTLKRLPRQVEAYNRLFDRCTVVLAECHLDAALAIVPDWWGVAVILTDQVLPRFDLVREAGPNGAVDAESLVRLLWREEVRSILAALGRAPDPRASRMSMWQQLLDLVELDVLKEAVRSALLHRDPRLARFPTRRSGTPGVRP
jgi:hypothetical protein